MQQEYLFRNIRELLSSGFSLDEIIQIPFDVPEFRQLSDSFHEQGGKSKNIQLLIEYAHRRELLDVLLDWCEKQNPIKYNRCQPYCGKTLFQVKNKKYSITLRIISAMAFIIFSAIAIGLEIDETPRRSDSIPTDSQISGTRPLLACQYLGNALPEEGLGRNVSLQEDLTSGCQILPKIYEAELYYSKIFSFYLVTYNEIIIPEKFEEGIPSLLCHDKGELVGVSEDVLYDLVTLKDGDDTFQAFVFYETK